VQKSSRGGKPSALESMQRFISDAKGSLTVSHLDMLLTQIAGYKKEKEDQERDGNMELLLHFLHHSKEDKVKRLESLRHELACLDSDIGRVGKESPHGAVGTPGRAPSTVVGGAQPALKNEYAPRVPGVQTQAHAGSLHEAALVSMKHLDENASVPGPTAQMANNGCNHSVGTIPPVSWTHYHQYPGQHSGGAAGQCTHTVAYGMVGVPTPFAPGPQLPQQQAPITHGEAQHLVETTGISSPPPPPSGEQNNNQINNITGGDGRLLRMKRRRIASQFEDLQHAYLRLRARRRAAGASTTALAVDSGDGEAPAAPIEGAVDDGLKEFSRILSVLTRKNKLRVLAEIPRPSLRQTSSIISSIEFDRDGALFATAGVSKRISVFDHASVTGTPGTVVHCPVVELVTRSKLSCLSWNRYVASHLASSDYEGVVSLWDVATSTNIQEYEAHSKRIWSVDFCGADPTLLVSGSDDCTVKLWSTRAPASLAQIDVKANVCSVQWRPESAHELAVGAADHSVHVYDIRRPAAPVSTISGHQKAVSYVRWCNDRELASASTDSTVRLWDVTSAGCSVPDRIFEGHTNEKNFVGLAVMGDFLACGSETHEVFVYYKPLSKPVAKLAFSGHSVGDELVGGGGEEDNKTFISAVCWRPGGEELLVANSYGVVRVLQLTGGGGP